jgi:hypothetical protein
MPRRLMARSSLAKISLYIGMATLVAFVVVEIKLSYGDHPMTPDSETSIAKTARLTAIPGEIQAMEAARLTGENRLESMVNLIPWGVVLADVTGGESAFLNGLAKATRPSAGERVSSTDFPARELGRAVAYAHNSFVWRPTDAGVEFRSNTNAHLDAQIGRPEWIMKSLDLRSMSEKQFDQGDTVEPESATITSASEQLARLIKRGLDFIKDGDIAASRLVLRRAADAGSAHAALLLGGTFDPNVLGELGVFGLTGNRATARAWYQKAMEFGSVEASRRIDRLAQNDK